MRIASNLYEDSLPFILSFFTKIVYMMINTYATSA